MYSVMVANYFGLLSNKKADESSTMNLLISCSIIYFPKFTLVQTNITAFQLTKMYHHNKISGHEQLLWFEIVPYNEPLILD